ncbi:hypothetical protein [Microbispora sp. ATCC PTA-5024]|uniref:hypothetical protein n=1 Tax=Microbispora sp. ATCC PTA-5024 TaxID=316330 RepID=UPI0018DDE9ED|nr:hypothetical protein [Microbispora sp. ATCC PTA-5024]
MSGSRMRYRRNGPYPAVSVPSDNAYRISGKLSVSAAKNAAASVRARPTARPGPSPDARFLPAENPRIAVTTASDR